MTKARVSKTVTDHQPLAVCTATLRHSAVSFPRSPCCAPVWTSAIIGFLVLTVATQYDVTADVVMLKNGGRVEGTILTSGSGSKPDFYVVRLASGGRIKLDAKQVKRVIPSSPAEKTYQALLADMPDTVDGHWMMAQWCGEQQLDDHRTFHLQQVLEHNSNHEQARQLLGYGFVNGQWIKADEWMERQGYVRYKGAWRLPQQVAIAEQRREQELAQKQWRAKIKRYRNWLNGRRHAEAIDAFREIRDTMAVPAVAEALENERDPRVRELLVDILGRLPGPVSADALVRASIYDTDIEVRIRSTEQLKQHGRVQAVNRLIQALRSKDNAIINRAASALGRLQDNRAVLPLIESLVTQHVTVVPQQGGNIRPSFSSSGSNVGGGLSVGGGPRRVARTIQNRSVLDALVSLTDQNFQFSVADWKDWYVRRELADDFDLRRDL